MDVKAGVLIGCGGCLVVCAVVCIAVLGWMFHISKDPEGILVEIHSPVEVVVGEQLTVDVSVTNQRSGKSVRLTDLDIAEEYLEAFSVLSTTPSHRSSEHIPIDNTRSFTFDRSIGPGETVVFSFELRAEREGIHRGDVDVCEGQRFLSKMVRTVVKPRPEAGG